MTALTAKLEMHCPVRVGQRYAHYKKGTIYHTLRKRINRMSVEKAVSLHHYARG